MNVDVVAGVLDSQSLDSANSLFILDELEALGPSSGMSWTANPSRPWVSHEYSLMTSSWNFCCSISTAGASPRGLINALKGLWKGDIEGKFPEVSVRVRQDGQVERESATSHQMATMLPGGRFGCTTLTCQKRGKTGLETILAAACMDAATCEPLEELHHAFTCANLLARVREEKQNRHSSDPYTTLLPPHQTITYKARDKHTTQPSNTIKPSVQALSTLRPI